LLIDSYLWILNHNEKGLAFWPSLQDGVVLGADTRATEDTVVADKNCAKIHYIASNI